MNNIFSLNDPDKPGVDENGKPVTTYAGGHSSGMALASGPGDDPAFVITWYANGYILEGGPAGVLEEGDMGWHSIDDPNPTNDPDIAAQQDDNRNFLQDLAKERAPKKLEVIVQAARDRGVNISPPINVKVNKKNEDKYEPPKVHTNFSGAGNSLASGEKREVNATGGTVQNREGNKVKLVLNIDGTQITVSDLTDAHTIRDLIDYIGGCVECSGKKITLKQGPRPFELSSDKHDQTLKEADLEGKYTVILN